MGEVESWRALAARRFAAIGPNSSLNAKIAPSPELGQVISSLSEIRRCRRSDRMLGTTGAP
ncbi:MAG TPA: hypothetical protein DEG88_13990 [Propionibacteriaceae bacterium]|nr:hypothetical protein [Propionibacteriaceae bacterium]HBY24326.1 hypothetical protein [Propionibacteriaceae bacterium]